MQIDMHYYGTYAMARAAGIKSESAKIIATSAQFVDDNAASSHVSFEDGARIDQEATAHHLVSDKNFVEKDQRKVWVPFHFLPGNEGDSYTEKLKCRKDSEIAREMCEHHRQYSDRPFSLHLMGIAAHVYADTFSHYGFSGVSSRGNKVDNGSFKFHEDVEGFGADSTLEPTTRDYLVERGLKFFENKGEHGGLLDNIKSHIAETASGALGHGSVTTYPDKPYLIWSFDYEERNDSVCGKTSIRNNPETFLEGCRALHAVFRKYVGNRSDLDNDDARDFANIEKSVAQILNKPGNAEARTKEWINAAESGSLFGKGDESIPEYDGGDWNEQWDSLDDKESYDAAMDLDIWRFYQAASLHRTYVLRDLLPKRGLIVN